MDARAMAGGGRAKGGGRRALFFFLSGAGEKVWALLIWPLTPSLELPAILPYPPSCANLELSQGITLHVDVGAHGHPCHPGAIAGRAHFAARRLHGCAPFLPPADRGGLPRRAFPAP